MQVSQTKLSHVAVVLFYRLTESEPHPRPPPHAPTAFFTQSFCKNSVQYQRLNVGTVPTVPGAPHFQTDRSSTRAEFVFELVRAGLGHRQSWRNLGTSHFPPLSLRVRLICTTMGDGFIAVVSPNGSAPRQESTPHTQIARAAGLRRWVGPRGGCALRGVRTGSRWL